MSIKARKGQNAKLEIRCTERYLGFESLSLRHIRRAYNSTAAGPFLLPVTVPSYFFLPPCSAATAFSRSVGATKTKAFPCLRRRSSGTLSESFDRSLRAVS